MQRRSMFDSNRGLTLLDLVIVFILLVIVAAVLFPVMVRPHCGARKSSCQNNLKELATAMHMYWTDYDGMLPSSVLHRPRGAKTWDAKAAAEFCAERGQTPPPEKMDPRDVHWVQVLYPAMKNKDIIWCPSDTDKTADPAGEHVMVSYIYRPAVDRAWYGSLCPRDPSKPKKDLVMKAFRKEQDYEFVADQFVFFEKKGWHWGDQKKGWSEGVSLNAAFMDGHVRNVRLKGAVNQPAPENTDELERCFRMSGEPMYYNFAADESEPANPKKNRYVQGQCFDPRMYYDNLP